MERKTAISLGYALLVIVAMLMLRQWWSQTQSVEALPYSTFEQYLKEGRIANVIIGERVITGHLKTPDPGGRSVVISTLVEPALAERLSLFGVPYTRVLEPAWLRETLSWIVPTLIFFALWSYLGQRLSARLGGTGGLIGIGRNKARVYMERQTGVRFEDVAGVDEAKAELREVVEFLRNPQHYGRLGARVPKGILLMGPTGTGKTLLARAVAGEAGVAFFSISGSEFIEMFVGVGAARVRDLFEQARAHAPAIIFIDELDALGKARGAFNLSGGHDEREQTLNQLLVELDGFDPSVGVVLLAATNRPEILDPALLRAGRFDRQVLVDRPDRKGRLAILAVHAKKIRLADGIDLDPVAGITVGLAGADLANLVNEAALCATRRDADSVTLADFTAAFERIVAGIERRNRVLSPREREVIAYHEMGHALTALALPGTDTVHKVSIVPHGVGALGYTLQRPSEDRYVIGRGELMNRIAVLLGGRAAEKLVFDELSTGAADDIAKATDIARDMVMRYGMDEDLGCVTYAETRPRFLESPALAPMRGSESSPETAQRIDEAVRGIIQRGFESAGALLLTNRAILERCARALIARESLDETEIRSLSAGLRPASGDPLTGPALTAADN
jgi:cell division protease FtsH